MFTSIVAIAVLVMCACVHVDALHAEVDFVNCEDNHCVDPIWVRGPCNLFCPNGQTCRHPRYGTVLKAGMIHDVEGQKCICKQTFYPDWHIAFCRE